MDERASTSLIQSNKTKLWCIEMFDLHLSIEQENREKQELERINNEASHQTDLYSEGEFDVVIGIEPNPEMWGELSYRSGFLTGITRHYDKKYQICLNNEPL